MRTGNCTNKIVIGRINIYPNFMYRQAWVDKILDQVQSQNLKSSIIEKEALVSAVKECTSKEKGTVSTVDPLTVIDAFDTPRLTFSVERKKYLSDEV